MRDNENSYHFWEEEDYSHSMFRGNCNLNKILKRKNVKQILQLILWTLKIIVAKHIYRRTRKYTFSKENNVYRKMIEMEQILKTSKP